MYFTTRLTSSVFYAMAYQSLLVTHEAVAATYELPPRVALTYSDAPDGDRSFLAAFLRALRMTEDEYAAARADYGPLLQRLDAANMASLLETLEGP